MLTLKRKLSSEKIYYTNDEGNKPFKVIANVDNTSIFKESILGSNNFNIFIKKYVPYEIYVGNSRVNILCNSEYEGNSILLKIRNEKKINNYKYVFIGHNIYEFELEEDDTFEFYNSLVDDNTSYPLLLGKKFVYFLLDKTVLPKKLFPKNIDMEDSYNYYYESGQMKLYEYEMPIKGCKTIHNPLYD